MPKSIRKQIEQASNGLFDLSRFTRKEGEDDQDVDEETEQLLEDNNLT